MVSIRKIKGTHKKELHTNLWVPSFHGQDWINYCVFLDSGVLDPKPYTLKGLKSLKIPVRRILIIIVV